jgi:hypothetical protein
METASAEFEVGLLSIVSLKSLRKIVRSLRIAGLWADS